jgi:inner membrane protein
LGPQIGLLSRSKQSRQECGLKIIVIEKAPARPGIDGPERRSDHTKLSLFGARIGDIAKPDAQFHTTSTLRFSGAERISVLAYGKTTHLVAQGDWRNPGFDGAIPPVSRNISNHGFTAEWSVPFIARGVRADYLLPASLVLRRTNWF